MNNKPLLGSAGFNSIQQIKSDRDSFMMMSDDSDTLNGREIDVKPILHIVEDILSHVTMNVQTSIVSGVQSQLENMEDKSYQAEAISLIDRISYEIRRYKFLEMDAYQIAVSLSTLLSSYSWDAKLVLTLAGFALYYGEFWLLTHPSNQLSKSMAILKQLPVIMEHSGPQKSQLDFVNNLIKAVMDLTWCIVLFKDLTSTYSTHDMPALSTAMKTIPTAVYWAIRGVIDCATLITSLDMMDHEYVAATMVAWELPTLVQHIINMHEHLRKQLDICNQIIEDKRNIEAYESLLRIFDMTHIDNMKVLKTLIYAKDDLLPLFDGSTKRRVNLEVLRRKNVLLLISSLNIFLNELSILEQIYNESRQHATRLDNLYEMVWIPIVDRSVQWTDPMQKQFEDLQSTMPWYTVHHPSLIDRAVIKFIQEKWHFRNKPILVVLDPQGKVVSPNAIHMMWIWGSNAFPFTSTREEDLWREETWRLELLVNGTDQMIPNWIKDGKYIFLYGGDDIEWIRRFTKTARSVAQTAGIPLEMVYVGKSTKKEQVKRIINIINQEKLSYTWSDLMIWFFWTRLESMLFSKIQLGRADDVDPTMQEIKKLLSYDKTGGWSVLSRGADVVVNGHGTTMLPTLVEYDAWKENVITKGFDRSFKDHHDMLHGVAHPCCRFEFPSIEGRIPESMKCPECQRHMEKYITFLCCHDDSATPSLY